MDFFYFLSFGWKKQDSISGENIRFFLILELESSISGNIRIFFGVIFFVFYVWARKCARYDKLTLTISQNSQENTCAGVSFLKLQDFSSQLATLSKKDTLGTDFSPQIWRIFKNTFLQLTRCFRKYKEV